MEYHIFEFKGRKFRAWVTGAKLWCDELTRRGIKICAEPDVLARALEVIRDDEAAEPTFDNAHLYTDE